MSSALTGDTTSDSVTIDTTAQTYSKDVVLKQKTTKWQTTIDWPADLDGADSDAVGAGVTATVTYNAKTGKATVSYK